MKCLCLCSFFFFVSSAQFPDPFSKEKREDLFAFRETSGYLKGLIYTAYIIIIVGSVLLFFCICQKCRECGRTSTGTASESSSEEDGLELSPMKNEQRRRGRNGRRVQARRETTERRPGIPTIIINNEEFHSDDEEDETLRVL